MISKSPELLVGDIVVVYIRRSFPPKTQEDIYKPVVKTKTIESIGLTGAVWTYNHDTEEPFHYSEVEYVMRKGKWKRA